jgi:hypothetical protein
MADNFNMEHFAQALYTAHEYNGNVVHPSVRADAEAFLIGLKESADGFALACNILAAEPFDQLRAFWGFNTLIHHINAVSNPQVPSAISSPDHADELYSILASWIRRVVVERSLPDFILNKHAQTMVIGAYAFYPNNWVTFFDDLFEFNDVRERGGGDQVPLYFLRVFEYIDEVVVDRFSQRAPQQRGRDMALKDHMREVAVRRAVDVWYNVLTFYHNRTPATGLDVAQLCLRVLEAYVEWIDVSLLLTSYWVNLLYFLMSVHALRVGACECITQLVAKKQAPPVKVETLTALNIVEALSMLAPLVTSQMPTTEEEEQFTLSVAFLMVNAGEQLSICVDQRQPGAAEMLRSTMPHILSLLNLPLFSIRDATVLFLQNYCKWEHAEALQDVMEAVFLQTCRPAVPGPLSRDEDLDESPENNPARRQLNRLSNGSNNNGQNGNNSGMNNNYSPSDCGSVGGMVSETAAVSTSLEERNIEQRKQLHNALRLIYRRNSAMVVQHCMYVVDTVISNPVPQQVCEGDAEGALRYLYELGEIVKMDALRPNQDGSPSNNEFAIMLTGILNSRLVREHPSPLFQLAVFEVFDRYFTYFLHHRDSVGTLLELLLQGPYGVTNENPRVRSRICYLFGHLIQSLKPQMVPYAEPIYGALSKILGSDGSEGPALTASDKADLYEALGTLLAASNAISKCADVLQSILGTIGEAVQQLQSSGPNNTNPASEYAVQSIADCISFMTSLAKGVGGIEATRMPDSPPQNPTAPAGLFPPGTGPNGAAPSETALADSEAAITAAVEAARQDPSGYVFVGILEHVVSISEGCLPYAPVRDKTLMFLQQFLNILGVASLPAIEAILPQMIRTTTIAEFPRILRVMYQSVNKTRGAASIVMGRSLLPITVERIVGFGDVSELRAQMNVISESTRELAEIYKQYVSFVQALVNSAAVAALLHPDMNDYLGTLMQHLLGSIRSPPEADLCKHALVALTRLTSAWCDPETSFEGFVFESILPTIFDELTNGSMDIRNDPKVTMIMSEVCNLLRAVAGKLGDRGLFRLYSLLTSGGGWISHGEANDFCAVIRDSVNAKTTSPLRQHTRQLLDLMLTRRSQAAAGTFQGQGY